MRNSTDMLCISHKNGHFIKSISKKITVLIKAAIKMIYNELINYGSG